MNHDVTSRAVRSVRGADIAPARPTGTEPFRPDRPQRVIAPDRDIGAVFLEHVWSISLCLARMLIRDRCRLSARTANIASRTGSMMLGCPPPARSQRPSTHPGRATTQVEPITAVTVGPVRVDIPHTTFALPS
jgi:hypothetical protein